LVPSGILKALPLDSTIGAIETNNWNGVDDIIASYTELESKGSAFKMPDGTNADEMNAIIIESHVFKCFTSAFHFAFIVFPPFLL
jgi:hypothetical protein